MSAEVKLDSLIDDCILKIAEFLSPVDVVNLASSCTRFFVLARSQIYPNFVKVRLTSTNCKKIAKKSITKKLLETMMIHFGATVRNIELNDLVFACSYLKMVLEKCPRLHTLNIRQHVFTKNEIEELSHNMRTNVEVLIFNHCKNEKAFYTLTIFPKLQTMKFRSTNGEELLSRYDVMPNLTHLEWVQYNLIPPSEIKQIEDLMGLNMRSLKLVGNAGNALFQEIASLMSMKLKNIESLTIDANFPCPLIWLTELNHLKHLKIRDFCCTDITKLLSKLSERGILEDLEVDGGRYNGDFPEFPKLRRLNASFSYHSAYAFITKLRGGRILPLLSSFRTEVLYIYDETLVAIYALNKSLTEIRVTNRHGKLTFSAIQQIIDIQRYAERPRLKLTISPLKLSLAEVISNPYYICKLI